MEGGFSISGKWMNRNNGQVIHVKDSVIDGDNMIIVTNMGTIDMNTFSNDYIQVSDDVYDASGKVIDNAEYDINEMIQYSSMKEQERHVTPDMLNKSNINETPDIPAVSGISRTFVENEFEQNSQVEVIQQEKEIIKKTVKEDVSYNEQLLEKLFEKKKLDKDNIKFNINIESDDFPKEELNMLKLIYDVTNEDIAKYIKKHVLTDDVIIESIENMIAVI